MAMQLTNKIDVLGANEGIPKICKLHQIKDLFGLRFPHDFDAIFL